MHNKWLDLIPFYVAGTLEPSDSAALEHHLARCEDCFRALNEWREVATVVRREAKAWAEPLPPLSQSFRAQLTQAPQQPQSLPSPQISQNGYQKTQSLPTLGEQTTIYVPSKSRRSSQVRKQLRPSLSLIAAVFAVVFFSGILIYGMTQSGDGGTKSASSGQNGTVEATPSITPFVLPIEGTPSPSVVPSPTRTPARNTSGSQTILPIPTDDISVLMEGCLVTATQAVNVYQHADVNSLITDVIEAGEFRRTVVTDGNGWYQVSNDQQLGIAGWVSIDDVDLQGDCTDLTLPTATLSGEICWIGVVKDGLINVYRSPGFNYDVISTIQPNDLIRTEARTEDGWYQVILENGTILAWVFDEGIETIGACDNLPIIAPSTLQPSATTPPDACLLYSVSGFGLHIYAGPGLSYDIINSFSDPLIVTGLSDNDWYRVERWVGAVRWIGWVSKENATMSGVCDSLPVIPSNGYIPNPLPSVTPTSVNPSSTRTPNPSVTPLALPTSPN